MDAAFREHLLTGRRSGMRYALIPPTRPPTGLTGGHLANRPGSSLEFMDHREYQPGDDVRRIDWSAYARSDKLTVNLYRQEVTPHADILLDGSRSMALPDTAKCAATLSLASALATAAENAAFTHAAWLAAEGWRLVPNSSQSPEKWQEIDFDYAGSLAESTARMPPQLRPRSIRILISDLLWMGEPHAVLSLLAQRAASVAVVQLLAQADVEPPRRGSIRLLDCETGVEQEVFVGPAARKQYRDALARHQQNWHRAAAQAGAVMTTLIAEDVMPDCDLGGLLAAQILKVA